MGDRRKFIKQSGGFVAAGMIGLTVLDSCKPASMVYATPKGNLLFIPKSQFNERKFVLVKAEGFSKPIYIKTEAEHALYLQCTHKGCTLKPAGDVLRCPCHGSEFDHDGQVLSPPADKPLSRFKVKEEGDQILIELKN